MSFSSIKSRIASGADRAIVGVAMLWGACLLIPIGMQYLCLFLLVLLMILSGRFKSSWLRYRQERFFLTAVLAFIGITFLTLLTQDRYYPETPANLWHGLRIIITLIVALSLKPEEAMSVFKAAVIGITVISVVVILNRLGWLGLIHPKLPKYVPKGNEWITMSVLLSAVSVWSLAYCLQRAVLIRWALLLGLGALLMVVLVMDQRTAWVTLVLGIGAIFLATWRKYPQRLLAASLSLCALVAIAWMTIPQVREKFELGMLEVEQSMNQKNVHSAGSMVIRYHMYSKTAQMIQDKPLTGWGIGGWTTQWKARIDPILHGSNMPHNDFLWMGAQSGLPGAFIWLALMFSLAWLGWKQRTPEGHLAFAFAGMALVNALVNSGTRDAAMGLPLLFMVGCSMAWSRQQNTEE